MDINSTLQEEFIKNACFRMDESYRMVLICIEKFPEARIWEKPNSQTNSIGNLILHLCGNITQYGIASLQEVKDQRNRPVEFSTKEGYSKKELIDLLNTTIAKSKETFNTVSANKLILKRKVQGFEFSGVGNIMHVVEHFSYHTGQIALWTKMILETDLGFYSGIDLTATNE